MSGFEAKDSAFETRVRASFAQQAMMKTIGATLERVAPGECEIRMPYGEAFTQQNGFLHAGVMTTVVDSACGYAALSLMPADAGVLSVEFKVNLMSPGEGEAFVARARVLKPGRTLTICAGDLFACEGGKEKLVFTMLATMIAVRER